MTLRKYSNKKISIIVPVYNAEKYFERCIGSVLKQSFQNFELIVVNDGSKGNIREIIKKYLDDERIRFIDNEQNQGLFRARVCGAQIANGDYIAFLDSDDYVSFDYYRSLVQKAVESESDIIIGKTVWERNDGYRFIYNFHDSCFSFDQIEGETIKDAFFGQEASCYSWHTVWNKIYSKSLWDKCEPFFQSVDKHIVMTEDILFSSILFYNAQRISTVKNDAYFYCINDGASTNVNNMSASRFSKNISDIRSTFSYARDYLAKNKASDEILTHLDKAELYYAKMWRHFYECDFKSSEKSRINKEICDFWKETDDEDPSFYFESVTTEWNGGLEYMKEQIADNSITVASFDIFDTLISRNLYDPSDIFLLLDRKYSELTGSSTGFSVLRKQAEDIARRDSKKEDISLHDIYLCIQSRYGVSTELIDELETLERDIEKQLCCQRRSGKELYDLAVFTGKKIYLVSDMYLEKDFIEQILRVNGYTGYAGLFVSSDCGFLKMTGNLYKHFLHTAGITRPFEVLHIGDNWNSDIVAANDLGIRTLFLPKAREAYENVIKGICTNRCSSIGYEFIEGIADIKQMSDNLGMRTMRALIFNKYFDNPYRTFNPESDFNVDPYFIGYSALGMHFAGLCRWIARECDSQRISAIHFCARDGAALMEACKIFSLAEPRLRIRYNYIQASRKALMPVIIRSKQDFYQMPVEIRGQTPISLLKILAFSSKEISEDDLARMENTLNINLNSKIGSRDEFERFINYYLTHFYSEDRHRDAQRIVSRYYSQIKPEDAIFDIGYSGRIIDAISYACAHPLKALFVHENYITSSRIQSIGNINIDSFYSIKPRISGLIREEIISETTGSCTGFLDEKELVRPIIEDESRTVQDVYPIKMIQIGAIDFVRDFTEMLLLCGQIDYPEQFASIKFEGFLRSSSLKDRKVFGESYFEDEVYGGAKRIRVCEFLDRQLYFADNTSSYSAIQIERDTFMEIIHKSNKVKRALLYILTDGKMFRLKLKKNIKELIGNN